MYRWHVTSGKVGLDNVITLTPTVARRVICQSPTTHPYQANHSSFGYKEPCILSLVLLGQHGSVFGWGEGECRVIVGGGATVGYLMPRSMVGSTDACLQSTPDKFRPCMSSCITAHHYRLALRIICLVQDRQFTDLIQVPLSQQHAIGGYF